MRLVYKETGKEVKVGDVVTDSRGRKSVVTYFRQPSSPASSGKISVKEDDSNWSQEYYVTCFGMEWIEREDR